MHVAVRQAILAAVLMDREDALGSASGAPESLLDRVAHDALREMSVDPQEARRRGVVHGQDEATAEMVPASNPSWKIRSVLFGLESERPSCTGGAIG